MVSHDSGSFNSAWRIVALSVIFILSSQFTLKHSLTYQGIASDLVSGQVFFTEEHEEFLTDERLPELTLIQYKNPEGKIIVRKKIDYTHHTYHPDFIQEDLRDGYLEGAKAVGDEIELIHRKNNKKSIQTKRVRIPEPAVVDGGFNYFLKSRWDDLLSGKEIKFNFAVPSQLTYYSFRVHKVQDETNKEKHVVVFKMEPDSLILRALASPIYLYYNVDTKRLMRYEGITTINDAWGKSFSAKIVYPIIGP